jgi:hypothetical protein
MKLLAFVSAALFAVTPDADAKCAMQHLVAQVQPETSNGAIVMTISASYGDPRNDDTSTWKLHADGKDVAPVIDVLAPGLSVYRLPKGVTEGELIDGTKTLVKISATTAKPLPAPKVKRVKHSEPEPGERKGSSRTTVDLVGDVPADAIAIVITDAKGKAMSFGRLAYGAGLDPYYHGRCGVLPNGTVEPKVGQSVHVFWVDKYGQASAKSAAIKVVKAR